MRQQNTARLHFDLKKFFMLLAMTAVCMAGTSVWHYLHIRPASAYTDQGVHRFEPYDVLPVQVKNTTGSRRSRRMNPTRTVYMLYYRTIDGSGYQWSTKVPAKSIGQKMIQEGTVVERRVLSITGENAYITTEAHLSAKSYTNGLKTQYMIRFFISVLYLMGYGCFWLFKKTS